MIYNKYKSYILTDLAEETIKVALLLSSYVPNAAHEFFADISANELVVSGYTAGGQDLENAVLSQTGNLFKFTADNPEWDIVGTASFKYAVFYVDSGDPATSRIISLKTFPTLRTVINNVILLEIPPTGILSLQ